MRVKHLFFFTVGLAIALVSRFGFGFGLLVLFFCGVEFLGYVNVMTLFVHKYFLPGVMVSKKGERTSCDPYWGWYASN